MIVIGENINASNKSVAEAIAKRDEEFLAGLVKAEADAGADFIDVNVGARHGTPEQEMETMEWLIELVQATTEKPVSIDSDNPNVIKAALRKYRGEKMIINSVNAEHERLESISTLAAEHNAWLVALVMGAGGIPDTVDERLAACDVIMKHVTGLGIAEENMFFDPLVLPISVDSNQGLITLETIERIKSRYPTARTVMGLSNISYGLPNRKLVNRAFLLMAASRGLDAAILDPLDSKIMSFTKVADMLTGKDAHCKGYIKAHRKGILSD